MSHYNYCAHCQKFVAVCEHATATTATGGTAGASDNPYIFTQHEPIWKPPTGYCDVHGQNQEWFVVIDGKDHYCKACYVEWLDANVCKLRMNE